MSTTHMECLSPNKFTTFTYQKHPNQRNCEEWEVACTIATLAGPVLGTQARVIPSSSTRKSFVPSFDYGTGPTSDPLREGEVDCKTDQITPPPSSTSGQSNDLLLNLSVRDSTSSFRMLPVTSIFPILSAHHSTSKLPKYHAKIEITRGSSTNSAITPYARLTKIIHRSSDSREFPLKIESGKRNSQHYPMMQDSTRSTEYRHGLFNKHSDDVVGYRTKRTDSSVNVVKSAVNGDNEVVQENNNKTNLNLAKIRQILSTATESPQKSNSFDVCSNISSQALNSNKLQSSIDCDANSETADAMKREIIEMEVTNDSERGAGAGDSGGRFVRTTRSIEEITDDNNHSSLSQLVKSFQPVTTCEGAPTNCHRTWESTRPQIKSVKAAVTKPYDVNMNLPYHSPKMSHARNSDHSHRNQELQNQQTRYNRQLETKHFSHTAEVEIKSGINRGHFSSELAKIIPLRLDLGRNHAPPNGQVVQSALNHLNDKKRSCLSDTKRKSPLYSKKQNSNNKVGNYTLTRHLDQHQDTVQFNSLYSKEIKAEILDFDKNRPLSEPSRKVHAIISDRKDARGDNQVSVLSPGPPGSYANRRVKSSTNLRMTFKATNSDNELEKFRSGAFGTLQSLQSYYRQLDTKGTDCVNPIHLPVTVTVERIENTKGANCSDHMTNGMTIFKEKNWEHSTQSCLDNKVYRAFDCKNDKQVENTNRSKTLKLDRFDHEEIEAEKLTYNTKLNDLYAVELATAQLTVKDEGVFLGKISGTASLPDCQLPPKKRRMFDHCKTGIWTAESSHESVRNDTEEKCLKITEEVHDIAVDQTDTSTDDTAVRMILLSAVQPDEDGDLPLHIAVAQGMLGVVERLLPVMQRLGVSIDSCNHFKQTPLHLAFITNHCDIARRLLLDKAKINLTDRHGNGILHLAVKCNSIDCLRLVLLDHAWKQGVFNVNALNYEGFTALHLAVQHHHSEALAVLLDSGRVNVNAIDGKNGRSALYFAAESNDLRATRILLAHNADVSVLSYSGCTAAQMANERSNFELVKLIERQEIALKN